jgi:uncharacterized membrane protein YebE (DUF533 family)
MAESRLNRDVFMALAAIAWSDGSLDPEEADAIVRAAVEAGLELDEIAEIEEATKVPTTLGTLDRAVLSKEDRMFVYALARWIAALDGVVSLGESAALEELASRLGIPDRTRAIAEGIAREVAAMPDGDRPARYDLVRLRELIGARLLGASKSTD